MVWVVQVNFSMAARTMMMAVVLSIAVVQWGGRNRQ